MTMHNIDPAKVSRLSHALTKTDEIIDEMDKKAEREGFPTVGPSVGGWFRLLARLVNAKRIFEFGSGFGYSAYWFAAALPTDGEIVLTEVDADELEEARAYLERGGFADRARFELGDALETIKRYNGPFDVALIDNEKDRYPEAFAAIREKIAPGGLVVADNAIAGPVDFEGILASVESASESVSNESHEAQNDRGDDLAYDTDEMTRGVANLLVTMRDDHLFDVALLPLGEGVVVARRTVSR